MLTFEQIKELIELVARHRLGGVEVERSGFRLKIEGLPAVVAVAPPPPPAASAPNAPAPAASQPPPTPQMIGAAASPALLLAGAPGTVDAPAPPGTSPGAGEQPAPSSAHHILTSPIVGTFYRAPSPDQRPFTEVGARVRKGQVLCIVEAMKLMNEIESDVDGVVAEIYPQNAQAIEFGEPLFALDVSSA